MKTLTSPVLAQSTAAQSGWCELYDFYLPSPIVTPFGTTATLRCCSLSGGVNFFTPKISPEPSGTQGNAQNYFFWPFKRQIITSSAKFSNDKLTLIASNATADWANMLDAVDWEAVNIVVRKISTTIATPTADDCSIIFAGAIDSAKINLNQIQFTVSNDLGAFQLTAPRENMHTNCRFNWADDQCTQIRFHPNNYKTKTVGSSSTIANVKSSGLTEDTGSKGAYGTDLVDALPDASITASSSAAAISGATVFWDGGGGTTGKGVFNFQDTRLSLNIGQAIKFAGTVPTGVTVGTTYYVAPPFFSYRNYYSIAATPGGPAMSLPTNAQTSALTIVNQIGSKYVRNSYGGISYWGFDTTSSDWGTLLQGYWQIPDAQAGLSNFALKPYIQFDFGSAVQPTLWQVQGANTGDREDLPRLIQFFSSTNNSTWKFETHYEIPPIVGGLFDVLIPNAQNARYWRICIRSRWAATLRSAVFARVSAYAGSRNFWANGIITFSATTSTTALQNVSRAIVESYSGELICAPLPVAPAAGDTFVIERGCSRAFNACCARQNVENFGGFTTLPYVSIVTNP